MALSALFWAPADKKFENWHLQIWTQFPSQKKFTQSTILLFFERCAGHSFHDLSSFQVTAWIYNSDL